MNRRSPRPLPAPALLLAVAAVAALSAPVPRTGVSDAAAATIRLEAEDRDIAYDFDTGVGPILPTSCIGASGGLAVNGIDNPGDAIGWLVELTKTFTFVDSLCSAGDSARVRLFAVAFIPEFEDPGPPDTLETLPGSGIG